MTQLIDESDPRYFTVTSDGPYDRHTYILHTKIGKQYKFDDYDNARAAWLGSFRDLLDFIEVVDVKKTGEGF